MKKHIIAAAVAATLAALAAVGAFASQDPVNLLEDPTETPTEVVATETPGGEPTETPTPDEALPTETATPEDPPATPEATETPADGTPTDTPVSDTATPAASPTPDGGHEDDEDDVRGIPDSNPVKRPENGDGVCEKHETIVKTTPSGQKVNVPCHAGGPHGDGNHDDEESSGGSSRSGGKGKGSGKNR
jgi:hypothetical protein